MNPLRLRNRIVNRWFQGSWNEIRIHGALSLTVVGVLYLSEPRTTLIVGGLLCVAVYAYLGFKEARKAPLWLSPLSFYFFWYCIGMGVSPLYLGLTTGPKDSVRFASDLTMVSLPDLATGYVLYLIGSLALHVGIQLFRPQPIQSEKPVLQGKLLLFLVAIWIGGILFQLNPASFGFLGATAKILSVAVVGSVSAFAVTQGKALGLSRISFVAILMLGTAGLFFANLASGSKAYIMFSFLPIFWFFLIRPRLRLWLPALALGLGIFYFALVAPVVQTSRQSPLEEGQNPRAHLIETFETWNREKPVQFDQSFLAEQLDQFVNRQFDAVPVGFLVGEVDQSGLVFGETMEYAAYAFVPRLLWPDKPSVTRGAWFSTRLGLFQTEADATTSVGMTAVGELYWNFGLPGIVIGMLSIGLGQGVLWRMAGGDPRGKPIHMLLYVSLMLGMTDMPEAVSVVVSLAVTFLTFKAAFVVLEMINGHRNRVTSGLKTELLHR